MKLIYLSRSINLSDCTLISIANQAHKWFPNHLVGWWDKGSPYIDHIHKADKVILVIPDPSGYVGKGMYSEYKTACNLGKTVVIAYQRKYDDRWQLYTVHKVEKASSSKDFKRWAKFYLGPNVTNSLVSGAKIASSTDLEYYKPEEDVSINVDVSVKVESTRKAQPTKFSAISHTAAKLIAVKDR